MAKVLIDTGFSTIASFPELKNTPIVIGESDPDGCAACQGPQLGYRNGTMYASYTAASIAREYDLADRHGVNFEGALTWAFEFEDQPYFAGFRVLGSNGLDLPVFNVFRMLGKMGGQRVAAESSAAVPLDAIMKNGVRTDPDVSVLASVQKRKVSVLVWHYHDDDIAGASADVTLDVSGLTGKGGSKFTHYRIDDTHSNAFTAWQRMGSPQTLTSAQYAQLEKAGRLTLLEPASRLTTANGKTTLHFTLPRQAVSLLVFE